MKLGSPQACSSAVDQIDPGASHAQRFQLRLGGPQGEISLSLVLVVAVAQSVREVADEARRRLVMADRDREPVLERVVSCARLAGGAAWPHAAQRIAPIGGDLCQRDHGQCCLAGTSLGLEGCSALAAAAAGGSSSISSSMSSAPVAARDSLARFSFLARSAASSA